jgi:hypothetical protein
VDADSFSYTLHDLTLQTASYSSTMVQLPVSPGDLKDRGQAWMASLSRKQIAAFSAGAVILLLIASAGHSGVRSTFSGSSFAPLTGYFDYKSQKQAFMNAVCCFV